MYEQGMVRMQAEGAKEASVTLGLLCADVKNKILLAMAEGLMAEERAILAANATDMEMYKGCMLCINLRPQDIQKTIKGSTALRLCVAFPVFGKRYMPAYRKKSMRLRA